MKKKFDDKPHSRGKTKRGGGGGKRSSREETVKTRESTWNTKPGQVQRKGDVSESPLPIVQTPIAKGIAAWAGSVGECYKKKGNSFSSQKSSSEIINEKKGFAKKKVVLREWSGRAERGTGCEGGAKRRRRH